VNGQPRWHDVADGTGVAGEIIPTWAMEKIRERLERGWPAAEREGLMLTADVLEIVYPRAQYLQDLEEREPQRGLFF
jgi:hypothetical protein